MLTDSSGRITRTTHALTGNDFIWAVMTNNQRARTSMPDNQENKANISISDSVLEHTPTKTETNVKQNTR
jgi:hypothetical protein